MKFLISVSVFFFLVCVVASNICEVDKDECVNCTCLCCNIPDCSPTHFANNTFFVEKCSLCNEKACSKRFPLDCGMTTAVVQTLCAEPPMTSVLRKIMIFSIIFVIFVLGAVGVHRYRKYLKTKGFEPVSTRDEFGFRSPHTTQILEAKNASLRQELEQEEREAEDDAQRQNATALQAEKGAGKEDAVRTKLSAQDAAAGVITFEGLQLKEDILGVEQRFPQGGDGFASFSIVDDKAAAGQEGGVRFEEGFVTAQEHAVQQDLFGQFVGPSYVTPHGIGNEKENAPTSLNSIMDALRREREEREENQAREDKKQATSLTTNTAAPVPHEQPVSTPAYNPIAINEDELWGTSRVTSDAQPDTQSAAGELAGE